MLEEVAQVLSYSAVGIVILVAGYFVFDALTPGHLRKMVMEGNPNAGALAASTIVALGMVMWFAIFFTGAGWRGLDDAIVFGIVGIATQAAAFGMLEVFTPGPMRHAVMEARLHPAIGVWCATQIAVALVVCASLT